MTVFESGTEETALSSEFFRTRSFQSAKVQPRCLKSDLGTCLRRFELPALFFDQRKLIYFRRLEGDLGMCRLNVRAVFLPTGPARLG